MAPSDQALQPLLSILDVSRPHKFLVPVKRINEGHDVSTFLVSEAYRDIMTLVLQLNKAMFPRLVPESTPQEISTKVFEFGSDVVPFSDTIIDLQELLKSLGRIIDQVPLDTGPRRFGNVSFRKWHELLEERATTLLEQHLPDQVRSFNHDVDSCAVSELRAYFLGSFGSSQRLDYGTGHELSFLAFLGGIWKLGGFRTSVDEQRGIVLGVIEPYLVLVRRLIQTYTLEPAGSHGVWGLDDHFFLPYVFGSAQYGPPIKDTDQVPTEGSLANAPDPGGVTKSAVVERERKKNMYFSAIGFIYDVKKGAFWEHSHTLYDISGVRAGWGKINKGMLKMYNAEVLSKFPVVQHFPFGSLFRWDPDPEAVRPARSAHISSQPQRDDQMSPLRSSAAARNPLQDSAEAPGADSKSHSVNQAAETRAPWMTSRQPVPSSISPQIRDPESASSLGRSAIDSGHGGQPDARSTTAASAEALEAEDAKKKPGNGRMPPPTRAPWAK